MLRTISYLLLVLALSAAAAAAQAETPPLDISDAGERLELRIAGATDLSVIANGRGRWVIAAVIDGQAVLFHLSAGDAPEPGPGPGPGPDPETPELTRQAAQWLDLVDPEARDLRDDLASAFRATANRIDAGELKTPAQIIEASAEANRQAVGDQRNAWLPWFEQLRDTLNAGDLSTPAEHAQAFRELADGLAGMNPRTNH